MGYRDPSDGSVREIRENPALEENSPLIQRVELSGISGQLVSGLPLESTKPKDQAKLEKSRKFIEEYFKRNPGQGV